MSNSNWVGVLNRIVSFILFLLFINSSLFAQEYVDVLKIESSTSTRSVENSPNDISITDFDINLFVPILLPNDDAVLLGLDYESIDTQIGSTDWIDVFSAGLRIGYNKLVNEELSVSAFLISRITGETNTRDSWNNELGFAAIARRNLSKDANYKFGVYVNNELFGPFAVPILGYYKKSQKSEINILVPSLVDVNYQVLESVKAGIRFNGTVKSYAFQQPGIISNYYISRTENQVGGYFDYEFKNIHLNVFGGYSAGSSLQIYEEGDQVDLALSILKVGDDRTQINQDLDDGFILKASLYYRIKTNKGD